jgi:hypothetical protein
MSDLKKNTTIQLSFKKGVDSCKKKFVSNFFFMDFSNLGVMFRNAIIFFVLPPLPHHYVTPKALFSIR